MKSTYWILVYLLSLFWGSSFFFNEIALHMFEPMLIAWLRMVIGSICLISVLLIRTRLTSTNKPFPKLTGKDWLSLAVVGLTSTAIPFILQSWGQQSLDSGITAILVASVPLFAVILIMVLPKAGVITKPQIIGTVIGFIGVLLFLSPLLSLNASYNLLPVIAVLLSAMSFAFSSIQAQKLNNIPRMTLSTASVACATIAITPVVFSTAQLPQNFVIESVVAVLVLGVFSTAIAAVLLYYLIQKIGAANTTLTTYLSPVNSYILATIFLGEELQYSQYFSVLVILTGLLIIDGRAKKLWESW